jgi:hypothetical protein
MVRFVVYAAIGALVLTSFAPLLAVLTSPA